MEPLMSYEGYKIIENVKKSNDLLNSFYEQMGYVITNSENPLPLTSQVVVKNESALSLNEEIER